MLRIGLVISAVLTASPAFGCSLPVFRYALEQWQPSPYALVVYHKGPLSKDHRAALAQIIEATREANIRVKDVDLENDSDRDLKVVWDREGKETPRVVLRYPDSDPQIPSVWSGPLSVELVVALFDSPARRAVFDRLTLGNAGVIVLLLSGDAKADEAARAMLKRELPRLASRIDLPQPTAEGPQIRSELAQRMEFPVVEVSRKSEELLARLLLGSEEGLDQVKGPIAFPVFGRGRALCSLHGKDLEKPGELQRSLEFLCRACSCQAKELNPGVDLLIAGNWDNIFEAEKGPAPREVAAAAETRPTSSTAALPELRSRPPDGYVAVEEIEPSSRPRRTPWLRYGLISLGLVITGYWVLRRHPPNQPDKS